MPYIQTAETLVEERVGMNDFLEELMLDFEEDNEHFAATFIRAIQSGNKDYVMKAHELMQRGYEEKDNFVRDFIIQSRDQLDRIMRGERRVL